jgi:beta-lactamase superfamily II metal-dependent hydrolase
MISHRLVFLVALVLAPTAEALPQAIPDSQMVVHFIDVGQADATLFEFSCGAMMIDAGAQDTSDANRLVDYLGRFFGRRTDLDSTLATIFITHNHIDHTRALRRVIERFHVRHVVENGLRGSPRDNGDAALRWLDREIAAGLRQTSLVAFSDDEIEGDAGLVTPEIDPLDCRGVDPTVALLSSRLTENPGWPEQDFKDKNNHSLVIRVDFGIASFIFTGDLEVPAIQTLLAYYERTDALDADVYQVGHHGSYNATTLELLQAMRRPEMAVISMGSCTRKQGQFNAFKFGHPRASAVDMLRSAVQQRRASPKQVLVADSVKSFRPITVSEAVYGTGWDGTVTIQATAGGRYRVMIERPTAPASC